MNAKEQYVLLSAGMDIFHEQDKQTVLNYLQELRSKCSIQQIRDKKYIASYEKIENQTGVKSPELAGILLELQLEELVHEAYYGSFCSLT